MNRWLQMVGFLLVSVALMVFWSASWMWPLRVFVVLIHEAGHCLAALMSGGQIVSFTISPDESGLALTAGGWSLLIYPAGYLGSVLFGALMMIVANRTRASFVVLGLLGAGIIALTVLYGASLFAIVFGLLFGLVFLAISWKARIASELVLAGVGFFSIVYGVWDIWSDILTHPELESDARMLSEITLIPTQVWGVFWMILALLLVYVSIRWSVPEKKKDTWS